MSDINGFQIDRYNVYKIKEGAKTSTCPKCSADRKKKLDKCMSVFWDTGLGQCSHCGERVQLHTYKKKDEVIIYKKPAPQKAHRTNLSDTVVDYFKARGISAETLDKLNVTEAKKWMPKAQKEINTIEFNYFLFDELINIKSRGANKDFKFEKECELIMYNLDSIINSNEAILVEGEIDCLSFIESGLNAVVSVPNGFTLPRTDGTSTVNLNYLDDYVGLFDNLDMIYLAFDNDSAGVEGQKEFIRRLGAERCYIIDFKDCKDGNEYLVKYGASALIKAKENATQVPLEGITTISTIYDELEDFWLNGAPKGMTMDLGKFDEVATFEFKQHTLLTSAPNSGKSDFIDHLIAHIAVKYNDPIGICSTENVPIKFHYHKLFRKIHGSVPDATTVKSEKVQRVKDFMASKFYHYETNGRYYLEDVLEKFAELVKRKGCRWFVIDPFNKVVLKNFNRSDINAYTAEYHMQIDAFNQKHNTHIFLVVHPVKLPNKEGSEKTYVMPNAYNIKGGGEHFDMSYNILGLVRDHEAKLVRIDTLKWKFQHLGEQGHSMWFKWNINNGRYIPVDYDEQGDEIHGNINYDNSCWINKNQELEEKKIEFKPQETFDTELF